MKGIIDSTLREGEQTVGISFSLGQKLEIIRLLCSIGVEEIELGIASRYDNTPAALIKQCGKMDVPARLAIWCRCNKKDISIAASAKPDVVSLSIPASDLHIKKKLGKSRRWILDKVKESIHYAGKSGIPAISLGLEDASRADPDFIVKLIKTAEQAGACRIRLADTVGIASPAKISGLVEQLKMITAMEIGVHMHNDFGMATANSLAALEVGADWADTTVLGLGERAGNARTEELIGYLSLRENRPYRVNELSALCHYVAQAAEKTISSNHPIIGSDIFSCETGLHLHGLHQSPMTYEPFEPESVGAERQLFFGGKIGRAAVKMHLASRGMRVSANQLCTMVTAVKKKAQKIGRPLHEKEMFFLLSELVAVRK